MSSHPYDTGFLVSPEQKEQFRRDGFVKLEGFLNANVINALLARTEAEMSQGVSDALRLNAMFSRVKYDFDSEKDSIYGLMERPYFRRALTELAECDLFLTFELCFEIERNVNKGYPWHIGGQSFGYQFAEEFGCTLWAPLHPVDPQGQRGGMAYVPEHVVSGDFMYKHIEAAVVSTMEAREQAGHTTNAREYADLRTGVLNSPAMSEILERHQVEDGFEPGDAFLFDKMVIHRSVMLGEGALPRRAAYVMRFVDARSRYDLKRAQKLEFPTEKYGKRLVPYKPFTRQHIEIAEAGAQDGDLLAECAYFDDRERRVMRREQPARP